MTTADLYKEQKPIMPEIQQEKCRSNRNNRQFRTGVQSLTRFLRHIPLNSYQHSPFQ